MIMDRNDEVWRQTRAALSAGDRMLHILRLFRLRKKSRKQLGALNYD